MLFRSITSETEPPLGVHPKFKIGKIDVYRRCNLKERSLPSLVFDPEPACIHAYMILIGMLPSWTRVSLSKMTHIGGN